MRNWIAGLAAALALVAGGGAAAQTGGVPDWRQSHLIEGNRAVLTLYRVAVCLSLRNPDEARALLATRPGSDEEAAAFAALMPDPEEEGCLRPTRRLTLHPRALLGSATMMRGALAEAFVRAGEGVAEPRWTILSPPSGLDEAAAGWSVDRRAAACAAQREPATVREMLRHNPASPGEYRALRALTPALAACLPQGAALQVNRFGIRILLAEGLYRLLGDPAAASAEVVG